MDQVKLFISKLLGRIGNIKDRLRPGFKLYLLAKSEEPDVVGAAGQAAGAVHVAGLDGLAPDLHHDVTLAAQILVAQGQKIVNDDG